MVDDDDDADDLFYVRKLYVHRGKLSDYLLNGKDTVNPRYNGMKKASELISYSLLLLYCLTSLGSKITGNGRQADPGRHT